MIPIFKHMQAENRQLRKLNEELRTALYEIAFGDETVGDYYRDVARTALNKAKRDGHG